MTTAPTLPVDLKTLTDSELLHLSNEAGRILKARCAAELPALVLDAVREALAEDGDTREPVSVEFSTTEWDNGYFWYEDEALVTFTDASTRTVDLSNTPADDALTDHASWQDDSLNDDDTLTVRFTPPTVQIS